MAETTHNFALPLVQPAQAQKHVTVNEALARLDALGQLVLASRSVAAPPPAPVDGMAWAVPPGAVNAWSGQGGRVAVASNGGWVFVLPKAGWRAWIADEGIAALHDGDSWRGGALALGAGGAGLFARVIGWEVDIEAGGGFATAPVLPANVLLIAVSARVIAPITGNLDSWRLGMDGAEDRFGSGLGTGLGAFARGLLGAPMALYASEAVVLTPEGGAFGGGGRVRLAAHVLEAGLPGV